MKRFPYLVGFVAVLSMLVSLLPAPAIAAHATSRNQRATLEQATFDSHTGINKNLVKHGQSVVNTQYLGPVLLGPTDGTTGIPIQPVSFSWAPYIDATEYQFQLSRGNDPTMSSPLVDAKTTTTAYAYTKALEYSTAYFWRVRETAPAPSDWSRVSTFTTEKAPTPPTTPTPAPTPPSPVTPAYVWVIIGIGAVMVVALLMLIVRTRRS
jgi:hypothetical protein